MSATCATSRHQPGESIGVFGLDGTSRNGRAPLAASSLRSPRTFVRYWAVGAFQGVGAVGPRSSLSAIHGVWQADEAAAASKSRSAAPTTVAGSAGAAGLPTNFSRFISQYSVLAPPARSVAATAVPFVAAITPGPRAAVRPPRLAA